MGAESGEESIKQWVWYIKYNGTTTSYNNKNYPKYSYTPLEKKIH